MIFDTDLNHSLYYQLTEFSPAFKVGMKLAHMRPLLQTQEGLGERAKVFWTFISSQRLSLFPIHTGLQKASLVI